MVDIVLLPGNSEGIEITVTSLQNNVGNTGSPRVILTAVLSSFGTKDLTDFDVLSKDFKRFPVLLVKGLVTPLRRTIAWLEVRFSSSMKSYI